MCQAQRCPTSKDRHFDGEKDARDSETFEEVV